MLLPDYYSDKGIIGKDQAWFDERQKEREKWIAEHEKFHAKLHFTDSAMAYKIFNTSEPLIEETPEEFLGPVRI